MYCLGMNIYTIVSLSLKDVEGSALQHHLLVFIHTRM